MDDVKKTDFEDLPDENDLPDEWNEDPEEIDFDDDLSDEFESEEIEDDESFRNLPMPEDLKVPFYKSGYVPPTDHDNDSFFRTPRTIYDYLDSHVYGHNAYKRALSTFVWKSFHGKRPQGALLVAGASGSGKTEMLRALQKIYKNIHIVDGSSVTPSGWKGNNKLCTSLEKIDMDDDHMGILCVDEIDKLLSRAGEFGTGLISEFLKILEGSVVNSGSSDQPKYTDTSKIAFILLGSFSKITEQKKRHHAIGFDVGSSESKNILSTEDIMELLPPEMQGRIEQTVLLDTFTEKNFQDIIWSDRYSPIKRISEDTGIAITITKKKAHAIAKKAFESGTRVRSMRNDINLFLNEKLFDNPNIKHVEIN